MEGGAMRTAAVVIVSAVAACILVSGATSSAAQPLKVGGSQRSAAKVVMPNVVGMRMDRATRRLRSIGLRVNEECSGIFGCIVKANWWICEQDPRPGRRLNRYTVVVIYGERRGEC